MPRSGCCTGCCAASMTGAGSLVWEFVFYATFGVVVTSSVAIAGVLLVFSFLIIPAAIGVMFASIARTAARDRLDCRHAHQRRRPCRLFCLRSADRRRHGLRFRRVAGRWRACSTRFCAAIAAARCASRSQPCAGVRAAILAGSAVQLAAAPRADQPLIDLAEYAVPSLRSAVFHPRRAGDLRGCRANTRSAIAWRRSS